MKILLLSAYDAASHRRWRLDLQQQFPDYQWTQLALPPRYFSWRVRGNSMSWAFSQRELLEQEYDLLIATSMVDLSALRGFVPSLARIPSLLYFHENQFYYPASEEQFSSVEPQMISLYSALCADALVFNSDCNRTSFIAGAEMLLRKLPDHVPGGLVELLRSRSQVLSVPLARSCFSANPKKADKLTLIWNHRWEYDKGPERLLAMLKIYFAQTASHANDIPFTLHVVGQQFRQQPAAFAEIKALLIEHNALGQWGFIDHAATYRCLLDESHLVLSTALHDFQGLSVLEAVAAGCIPLLPDRQAYPEWFGANYCYASDMANPEREAQSMAQALQVLVRDFAQGKVCRAPDIERFSWTRLHGCYAELFTGLAHSSHG